CWQTRMAKRAGVGHTAGRVRSIDLHDITTTALVDGNNLVPDHLRQRERQEVPRQVRRTHAALSNSQGAITRAEREHGLTIAFDPPTLRSSPGQQIVSRRKRLIRLVVEGIKRNRRHVTTSPGPSPMCSRSKPGSMPKRARNRSPT